MPGFVPPSPTSPPVQKSTTLPKTDTQVATAVNPSPNPVAPVAKATTAPVTPYVPVKTKDPILDPNNYKVASTTDWFKTGHIFGKALEFADIPGAVIRSTIKESFDAIFNMQGDHNTPSFADWRRQAFGPHHITGKELLMSADTSHDNPAWANTWGGIGLDIGLDPLMHVSAIARAVTGYGEVANAGIRQALIHGGRNEVAASIVDAAKAAGIEGEAEVQRLAVDAAQRGRGAIVPRRLKQLGISEETQRALAIPELGNSIYHIPVPGTKAFAETGAFVKGGVKSAFGATRAAEVYRSARISEKLGLREAVNVLRDTGASPLAQKQALDLLAEGAKAKLVARPFIETVRQTLKKNDLGRAMRNGMAIKEGMVNSVERGVPTELGRMWNETMDHIYTKLNSFGVHVDRRANYVPHIQTDEAINLGRKDKAVNEYLKQIGSDRGFQKARMNEGTIDELNAAFQTAFPEARKKGINLFHTDPGVIMDKYLASTHDAVAEASVIKGLTDAGHITEKLQVAHDYGKTWLRQQPEHIAATKAMESANHAASVLADHIYALRQRATGAAKDALHAQISTVRRTIDGIDSAVKKFGRVAATHERGVAAAEAKLAIAEENLRIAQQSLLATTGARRGAKAEMLRGLKNEVSLKRIARDAAKDTKKANAAIDAAFAEQEAATQIAANNYLSAEPSMIQHDVSLEQRRFTDGYAKQESNPRGIEVNPHAEGAVVPSYFDGEKIPSAEWVDRRVKNIERNAQNEAEQWATETGRSEAHAQAMSDHAAIVAHNEKEAEKALRKFGILDKLDEIYKLRDAGEISVGEAAVRTDRLDRLEKAIKNHDYHSYPGGVSDPLLVEQIVKLREQAIREATQPLTKQYMAAMNAAGSKKGVTEKLTEQHAKELSDATDAIYNLPDKHWVDIIKDNSPWFGADHPHPSYQNAAKEANKINEVYKAAMDDAGWNMTKQDNAEAARDKSLETLRKQGEALVDAVPSPRDKWQTEIQSLGEQLSPHAAKLDAAVTARDAAEAQYKDLLPRLKAVTKQWNDLGLQQIKNGKAISAATAKVAKATEGVSGARAAHATAQAAVDAAVAGKEAMLPAMEKQLAVLTAAKDELGLKVRKGKTLVAKMGDNAILHDNLETARQVLAATNDPAAHLIASIDASAALADAKQVELGFVQDEVGRTLAALNDPAWRVRFVAKVENGYKALGDTHQIPGWIDDTLALRRRMEDPQFFDHLFRFYDKGLNVFKGYAMAFPRFIMRSTTGNLTKVYLEGGIEALKSVVTFEKFNKMFLNNPTGYLEDAAKEFKDPHLVDMLDRALSIQHSSSSSASEVFSSALGQASYNPLSSQNLFVQSVGRANRRIESSIRGGHAFDVLQRGGSDQLALSVLEKWHFNYTDITTFDRNMKRIMPFWTFFSKNIALEASTWVQTSSRLNRTYFNVQRNLEYGQVHDKNVPENLSSKFGIQLASGDTGDIPYSTPDIPALRAVEDFGNLTQMNLSHLGLTPLISIPKAIISNKDPYTGKKFKNWDAPVSAPGWMRLPLVEQTLEGMGVIKSGTGSGDLATTDKYRSLIGSLFPQTAVISGSGHSKLNQLGLSVSWNTDKTRKAVEFQRRLAIQEEINRIRALGNL